MDWLCHSRRIAVLAARFRCSIAASLTALLPSTITKTIRFMNVLCLLAVAITFSLPLVVQAVDIDIVSDNSWRVSDANGRDLGHAQPVCLNAGSPANCPQGAMLYDYPYSGGWAAHLPNTPQAVWIWAPKVTGASKSAQGAEFSFKKDFSICGSPQDATIWVAADNDAEVFINGISVLTWDDHSTPGSAIVPATYFQQSPHSNSIEIKVRNGANPPDCSSDQYRCNPAGLVFAAQLADSMTEQPKCPGNVDIGASVPLCSPPQMGRFGICACVAGAAYWLEAGTCAHHSSSPAPGSRDRRLPR